jgi:peptidoglycan hydrolase-like protein with peptidoglycan-binding domain
MLKRGDRGENVIKLQNALNQKTIFPPGTSKLVVDGIFGPATESILKLYQVQNGLTADGIAGPATLSKLGITLSNVVKSSSSNIVPSSSALSVSPSIGIMDKIYGMFGGNKVLALSAIGGVVVLGVLLLTMNSGESATTEVMVKPNPKKKRKKHKRK